MSNSFLDKRLTFCPLKGLLEAQKDLQSLIPELVPIYCEYASESQAPGDPYCELAKAKVSEVKQCPYEGNQSIMRPFGDSCRDTSMQMSLLNCEVDPDEIYITRIFGVTDRGRYHIMKRAYSTYCRGTADIVQFKHIELMPSAKVCKHCFYEYMKNPGAMLYI